MQTVYHASVPRPPLWYLKSVDLFSGISHEELHELVAGIMDKVYSAKSLIYTPQDLADHVYVLKEGEVTLYQTVDGKKVVLDVLKPGSVFGNISFDPDTTENHYAEVTQKAYTCNLPHNFFLQFLQKRPDIALRALKILSQRVSQYEMQIRTLSALQARDRILANIRLLNAKDDRSILPSILRIPTKITHEKLGHMTGLTRETVTKELNELEKQGYITVDKKHIRLTDKGMNSVLALQ